MKNNAQRAYRPLPAVALWHIADGKNLLPENERSDRAMCSRASATSEPYATSHSVSQGNGE